MVKKHTFALLAEVLAFQNCRLADGLGSLGGSHAGAHQALQ